MGPLTLVTVGAVSGGVVITDATVIPNGMRTSGNGSLSHNSVGGISEHFAGVNHQHIRIGGVFPALYPPTASLVPSALMPAAV